MNFSIIFDMDGVIIDSNYHHFKAWREFLKKHDISITRADYAEKMSGKINRKIIEMFFGELPFEQFRKYALEKEAIYRELSTEVKLTPGLLDFLNTLDEQKIPRAIATSAPSLNVAHAIEHTSINKYFEVIVDSSCVTKHKPHPEVYLSAAKLINSDPANCVVFEDSLPGIASAQAAGMKVIAVATTHPRNELEHADLIINDFTEINLKKIKELLSN